jgi:YVTN family beta-propeller protein
VVNQTGEECDDGNESDDDCCSTACGSAPDGQGCGGGLCGGDQTCRSGVCTQNTAEDTLACLAPFTTAGITNFDDGTASPVDLLSGTVGDPVTIGRGAWGVAIHPGGDEIWITARTDDRITVLDGSTFALRATIDAGDLPLGIVFDPTGTRAYVASFGTDRVLVLDAATRQVLSQIPVGNGPSGLALDPTGTRLYVSNYGGATISVIDIASERVVATVKTKKRPLELALDAPRGRLYVTNFGANQVSVIGTISNSVLTSIRVGKRPFGVAVTGAGRAFVTNGVSDSVSVIDGEACQVVDTIPVGEGPLGIGLDLTGSRALIANGNDGTLSILDTAAGSVVATLPVGETPVAFGGFVGPLGAACPRPPLVCDDVNPMTLDSCDAETGCRFQPYDPPEAARVGLDALDTIVREAGVEPLGGTTRAALLSRLCITARDELVEGSGTLGRRIKRADRNVRRFAKVVRKAIRRGRMSCGVGQEILDLSRGIHVQMRLARKSS